MTCKSCDARAIWLPAVAILLASAAGCALVRPPADTDLPDTVPDFAAARFTEPAEIDNSYLPFVPGTTRTYEVATDEGVERTVVEALDETREVMGLTCRVVRDRAWLADVLIEDTRDWFAQDDAGNVWYMGEDVDNYNYDASGALIDVTHEGSWEAGLDVAGAGAVAHPGFAMPSDLMVGDFYSQEYYPGEAEDMGEVVGLEVPITLRDGTMYSCLQTRDFTPLEPDVNEYKYYAPGVGLVAEEHVGSGERAELVVEEMPG